MSKKNIIEMGTAVAVVVLGLLVWERWGRSLAARLPF